MSKTTWKEESTWKKLMFILTIPRNTFKVSLMPPELCVVALD